MHMKVKAHESFMCLFCAVMRAGLYEMENMTKFVSYVYKPDLSWKITEHI